LFVIAGACAVLSLGGNFVPAGWALGVPPFSLFRYPAKYLVAVGFIVSILAPVGLRRLRVWKPPRAELAGAVMVVIGVGSIVTRFGPWRSGIAYGFYWFAWALGAAAGALLLRRAGLIAALAVAECAVAHYFLPPTSLQPASAFDETSPVAAQIRSEHPGRVSIEDDQSSDAILHSRMKLAASRWMEEHLRAVEGYGFRDPPRLEAVLPAAFPLLGVTHLVRRPGAQLSRAEVDAFPRAFVVQSAAPASDAEALATVTGQTVTLRRAVMLSEGPRLERPACDSSVEVSEPQPERVVITADVCDDGVLVLTDGWYPGWRASVDGQSSPVWRADYLLRATPVSKGRHEIVFTYRPYSLWAGAVSALLALLFLLARPASFKPAVNR
jgi:hypothetical protein